MNHRLHLDSTDWRYTSEGKPRGYLDPAALRELWFHTGTICNLSCPFCLEGSGPGDKRLQTITLDDARPFVDEALQLGVEQFSFTGGEPFVNKQAVAILDYCLQHRPAMVLTNGTKPIRVRWDDILALRSKPNPLHFRISFDHPEPAEHDKFRGEGNFHLALQSLGDLHRAGFGVSIARQSNPAEDTAAVNAAYQDWFRYAGVPTDTNIVAFPDFLNPGAHPDVPEITTDCIDKYTTVEQRESFMCNFSKMVVKRAGRMRVYACTLVDDDTDYELGDSLSEAMQARVMLRHHRCFLCFSCGASCSETKSAVAQEA